MENLIKIFLAPGRGDGHGDGRGYGSGYGSGYGRGDGRGYGRGDGRGYGSGYGRGDGRGYGSGDGSGDGRGDGRGDGSGDGSGYGEFNGHTVYYIDNIATLLYKVYVEDEANGWAVGRIVRRDLTTERTYIAKRGYVFAHGATLQEAVEAANDKLIANKDIDDRIDAFVNTFPLVDSFVSGEELFRWHHRLTGSCLQGRKNFVHDRGLDMGAVYTILEFFALTRDAFGGSVIKRLEERYRSIGGGSK